jgi:DNA (cytosine-5)-methyltransferase 1
MNELRSMHLFAGIGGGLLADLILGHKPIVAVEWDKYACEVLRQRANDGWFPDLSVWEGDVRMFDPSEYAGKLDIIHAGFPCQDISVAGKQAGLGEGTRSGLYRDVLRIAGVVRPRYVFLENVSAILSGGLGTVLGDLAAMGYDAKWCCVKASDVGAPHGRDRWWCLATMADTACQQQHWAVQTWDGRDGPANSGFESANTISERLEGSREERETTGSAGLCGGTRGDQESRICLTTGERETESVVCRMADEFPSKLHADWWDIEPNTGRLTNISTNRSGRLKGLGNAQVPLQCAVAFKLLMGGVGHAPRDAGTVTV